MTFKFCAERLPNLFATHWNSVVVWLSVVNVEISNMGLLPSFAFVGRGLHMFTAITGKNVENRCEG